MAGTMFQIRYDGVALAALERQVRQIPGGLSRIAAPALNRTMRWARTQIKREVAGQCKLKSKRADRLLKTINANHANLNARVEVENRRVPIGKFLQGRKGPASVTFPSGLSMSYPRHFRATMPSGHKGVFVRARVVKPGVRIKRERRVKTSKRGQRIYTTELPIYEQTERLGTVMDMGFLKRVQTQGVIQLNKEIASKMQWLLAKRT